MSSLPHYLLLLVFLNAALFNEHELSLPGRHAASAVIGEQENDPYQSTSLFEFLVRTFSDQDLPVPEDEGADDPEILRRSTQRQSLLQLLIPAVTASTLILRLNPFVARLNTVQPADASATIIFAPVRRHLHLYYMF